MAWYDEHPITHGYLTEPQSGTWDVPHYADDVETSFHEPITSLFEGDVVKAKYDSGLGSQLFIKTNVPGIGPTEEYFYHLDRLEVQEGQHVKRGDEVGLAGGQTNYGEHPSSTHYSRGLHTHVGFFNKYVPYWAGGTIPYGPDITPYLKQGGAPSSGDGSFNCKDAARLADACTPFINKPPYFNPNFDPTQCMNCKTSGQSGPAMGQTGPTGAGQQAGQAVQQGFLAGLEQSLGVESNTDLLYRVGFIGAGILFIIFGLVIFAKGFSPQVTLGA